MFYNFWKTIVFLEKVTFKGLKKRIVTLEETDVQKESRISLLELSNIELTNEVQSLGVKLLQTQNDLNEAREEIRNNTIAKALETDRALTIALVDETINQNSNNQDMVGQNENLKEVKVKCLKR